MNYKLLFERILGTFIGGMLVVGCMHLIPYLVG